MEELQASSLVNRVYLIGQEQPGEGAEGCGFIKTDGKYSTDTIRKIADCSRSVGPAS